MIKLIKPFIQLDDIYDELQLIFASGQLTKGTNVEKFERALCDYTTSRNAFLTTSATTALSLCLKAVGVKAGDKVAVSDFSFPATSNVVEDLGAIPVFIDVDRDTFNMSESGLLSQACADISAVIFVDSFGNASGLERIKGICEQYQIPLIEDAACAIGSSVNDRKVGAIADLTCFSFHPRKLLTTGEGGAILTGNTNYAKWLKVKLNHGAESSQNGKACFTDYGYNYRMSEIQALMGWKQIKLLDEIIQQRKAIVRQMNKYLEPLGFTPQKIEPGVSSNYQSMVYLVPDGVNRDELILFLKQKGIESTIGTYSLSGTEFNRHKYARVNANSVWLEQNTITLPCYPEVDVEIIRDEILNFINVY